MWNCTLKTLVHRNMRYLIDRVYIKLVISKLIGIYPVLTPALTFANIGNLWLSETSCFLLQCISVVCGADIHPFVVFIKAPDIDLLNQYLNLRQRSILFEEKAFTVRAKLFLRT